MTDKRTYGAWDFQIYKGLTGPERVTVRIGESWCDLSITEWSRAICYPINAEMKNETV